MGYPEDLLATGEPLEFQDIPQVEKLHAMLYNEVYEEARERGDEAST